MPKETGLNWGRKQMTTEQLTRGQMDRKVQQTRLLTDTLLLIIIP